MGKLATQINDNLYYDERSAGGLVYKIENNKVFWLLIKTIKRSKNQGYVSNGDSKSIYKFPKGHLKKDEFLKDAALREVEEEGKVKAKIIFKLGSNNYIFWDKLEKKKIIKKVTFFLMEYASPSRLQYYDQELVVDREWMSFEDAIEKLAFDSEKVLLKKAKVKLDEILRSNGVKH